VVVFKIFINKVYLIPCIIIYFIDLAAMDWAKYYVIGSGEGLYFDGYWVGARQVNYNYIGQPRNKRDFEWLDGTHVNDELWIQGYEPNNNKGEIESCVNFLNKDWFYKGKNVKGWLNDRSCDSKHKAMCKIVLENTAGKKSYYVASDEAMCWNSAVNYCKSLKYSVKTELAQIKVW